MDLTLSRAAVVVARSGHTPRPYVAMEATRSGVSLLLSGSAHLHHVDRVAPPPSCCLARYTRSPTVVSFWFARSLIRIESPTACRPRVYFSGSSSTPSPSTTRIFSEQQGCCCVTSSGRSTAACVSASLLHLHHCHLCIDDCAALVLLIGLLSSSYLYPHRR
jgi:hypothetical protein